MTRQARAAMALTGALALALAVTGCPREKTESGGGAQTGGGSQNAATGGTKKLRIAVMPKGTSQSFWLAVKAGADDAAKELGLEEPTWEGPASELDINRQIDILNSAVTRKVDGIVLAACSASGLSRPVAAAQQAGIPVVTIDSGVQPDTSSAFLATNNVKGGDAAADALAKVVGSKGTVGLIPFIKGAQSSDERQQGFTDGLKRYPNMKLGPVLYSNADVETAVTKTNAMVASTPGLAGIFAANQAGAEGAIRALKTLGKAKQIKLVCFDASQPEIDALKDGTVDALIVQNPYKMGYEGVKTVVKAIRKEKIDPRVIDTGVTTVTRDNLNTPEIQKLLNPTAK